MDDKKKRPPVSSASTAPTDFLTDIKTLDFSIPTDSVNILGDGDFSLPVKRLESVSQDYVKKGYVEKIKLLRDDSSDEEDEYKESDYMMDINLRCENEGMRILHGAPVFELYQQLRKDKLTEKKDVDFSNVRKIVDEREQHDIFSFIRDYCSASEKAEFDNLETVSQFLNRKRITIYTAKETKAIQQEEIEKAFHIIEKYVDDKDYNIRKNAIRLMGLSLGQERPTISLLEYYRINSPLELHAKGALEIRSLKRTYRNSARPNTVVRNVVYGEDEDFLVQNSNTINVNAIGDEIEGGIGAYTNIVKIIKEDFDEADNGKKLAEAILTAYHNPAKFIKESKFSADNTKFVIRLMHLLFVTEATTRSPAALIEIMMAITLVINGKIEKLTDIFEGKSMMSFVGKGTSIDSGRALSIEFKNKYPQSRSHHHDYKKNVKYDDKYNKRRLNIINQWKELQGLKPDATDAEFRDEIRKQDLLWYGPGVAPTAEQTKKISAIEL